MKKLFTKYLSIYMAVAMIITVCCIFLLQTFLNQKDNTANSYEKLAMVEEKIAGNNMQIEQLKQSLNDNFLAKTRAFAYMLKEDPKLAGDQERLEELCGLLEVHELHVIDEKGIIIHSSVTEDIGFDMGSKGNGKGGWR